MKIDLIKVPIYLIYKSKHIMCVSHDVLRFNTMVESTAVKNWDQVTNGNLVSIYLFVRSSILSSIHLFLQSISAPSGTNRGRGHEWGGQHRGSTGGPRVGGPTGGGNTSEGGTSEKELGKGSSTGALCTGFTLVTMEPKKSK